MQLPFLRVCSGEIQGKSRQTCYCLIGGGKRQHKHMAGFGCHERIKCTLDDFFLIERFYYYTQNTLLKMLSLMHCIEMIKELDDYRGGFWEAPSGLRMCNLILNSEFPGFCSVFCDLVFLETFCMFWCLVAVGCLVLVLFFFLLR